MADKNADGMLLVLGNLMLDMTTRVEDDYLKSYDLFPDTIQTAEPRHMKIYEEICSRPEEVVTLSPGGSALNTIRMIQCILGYPKNAITLLGAVGADDRGDSLVELLEKEGINAKMIQKVDGWSTAKCACLLTDRGSKRTLVTYLGAATQFSYEEFMKNSDGFKLMMGKVKFVYVTGYFLKVSPQTVMEVVKSASNLGIPIILNLNAVWVTTLFAKELAELLPYVDVLFGNESEILSFAQKLEINETISSETSSNLGRDKFYLHNVAIYISSQLKSNGNKEGLVVITRGENPIICARSRSSRKLQEYPINIPKDCIVDTTGGGDGFVGGFLAAYTKNMPVDNCIACGIWAAGQVLKNYGFSLPTHVPQQFS